MLGLKFKSFSKQQSFPSGKKKINKEKQQQKQQRSTVVH